VTFFKEKLMRNGYEGALCRLASDAIIGKSLNLAIQAISGLFLLSFPVVLDVLDSCLFACFFGRMNSSRPFWPRSRGNMKKDFPQPKESTDVHKTTHQDLEVIRTARVADRSEYDMELANYLKKLEENELDQVKEYILHRVAFVVSELDNDLPAKICKQNLAREAKRKLCVYNVECDGCTSWSQVKQRRLNPFGGVGPGVSKSRLETVVHTYEARCRVVF
jgi:hypothetical protein